MSKRHLGSSIDDFLKEEGIFEEPQAQAVKGSCGLATCGGDAEKENIQSEDGHVAENQSDAG